MEHICYVALVERICVGFSWIVRFIAFMLRSLSFCSRRFLSGGGLFGLLLLSLALVACGSLADHSTTASTPINSITVPATFKTNAFAPANTIIVVNIVAQPTLSGNMFTFVPASIAVLPGTVVVWKNSTGEDVTLTSPMHDVFTATSKVTKNGTLRMIFTTTQAISYFSKEHPEARGSLVVQSPSTLVDVKLLEQMGSKGIYALSPAGLVIKVGTMVNWSNETDQDHVLVSDKAHVFTAASSIAKNGTYKKVFSIPGTYNYYSKAFPTLRGIIVVVP
jgi:plastocyanin